MKKEFLIYDVYGDEVITALLTGTFDISVKQSLIAFAEKYGVSGNIPQLYLADFIFNADNPLSNACERRKISGDIAEIARNDLLSLQSAFLARYPEVSLFYDYKSSVSPTVKGKILQKITENLRKSKDFPSAVMSIYRRYGRGNFAFYSFFTLRDDGTIQEVENPDEVRYSDLFGYDIPKKELYDNTVSFVTGANANNVLLYGDNGTGKSTAVRALINEFSKDGLRLIEVDKRQAALLPALLSSVRKRNYRFIIFMDDLSFENFETEYKYLKAVLDGGVEVKPDNVLIYATSNRRRLIKENYSDRNDEDDKRHSDTVEEKLSLSNRFGLNIRFCRPNREEYHEIVLFLAQKKGVSLPKEELIRQADVWATQHGGLSGRTAKQFLLSFGK